MKLLQRETVNKAGVKAEIDAVCRDLLTESVHEYISTPVVMVIYLGEESYRVVNASLRDAFTTSFKVEPSVYEITLEDSCAGPEVIYERITEQIAEAANNGKNYEDTRFVFVSVMDDPIFESNAESLAEGIRGAFEELSNVSVSTKKTSFYGIFRQARRKATRNTSFAFVNAGKDLWRSIYHMEVPFFAKEINLYTQLIAIHCIGEDYTMVQDPASAEYAWRSLSLKQLKLPELLITRVLREIYARQMNGKNINYDEWTENIGTELENLFDQLLSQPEHGYEQFIPLNFRPEEPVQEVRTGLFGRSRQQEVKPSFHGDVIKDEVSLDRLLQELLGDISLTEEECDDMLETITSSATSIDNDHNRISQFVREYLTHQISEVRARAENLRSRNQRGGAEADSVTALLAQTYQRKKELMVLQKKAEILEFLVQQLSSGNTMSRIVSDIYKKNKECTDILDELSKNQYGGTLEHVSVSGLPAFRVNQTVHAILKGMENSKLYEIINNEEAILQQLERFLAASTNAIGGPKEHNLGEINGVYNQLENIQRELLMTPNQAVNPKVSELVKKFSSLSIKTGSLYRENTFYIISYRNYTSDRYIYRYREE